VLSEYRFVDRWFVNAPVDVAYDVIGDTLGYPRWWGDVFTGVEGDGGPPRPGRHVRIVSRGFLPSASAGRPRSRMPMRRDTSGSR
jgi:hypothetical protein